MQARAHRIHDILNLRPDQDSALNSLLASFTPRAHGGGLKQGDAMDKASLTTPERLDRVASRMAERQAAFQQRATAIKQFYAVLSPEQQRAFDALPGLAGGGHHMFGGMGPHGMDQDSAGGGYPRGPGGAQ